MDVINNLDFPEANQLLRYLPAMARKVSALKERAKKAGIPVVYVNIPELEREKELNLRLHKNTGQFRTMAL